MQYAFRDAECAKIPLIKVTKAERDWLKQERLRAMSDCPDLEYQRDRKDPKKAMGWRAELLVHGRSRDGCLEVSVQVHRTFERNCYTRKLRVPAKLGSTSGRDVHLRQERRRA